MISKLQSPRRVDERAQLASDRVNVRYVFVLQLPFRPAIRQLFSQSGLNDLRSEGVQRRATAEGGGPRHAKSKVDS